MAIFNFKPKVEERSLDFSDIFNAQYYGTIDQSYINQISAFENEAVFSAVKIIAETLAGLPLNTFVKKANGVREKDNDYFLYDVLNYPNAQQNKYTFWETFYTNLLAHGNGYAYLYRNQRTARVESMYIMPSQYVKVKRNSAGKIEYHFKEPNKELRILKKENVFHVLGTSYDGLVGLSPIELFKLQILESITADNYNYNFFDKGLLTNVSLSIPGTKDAESFKKKKDMYIKQFQNNFSGIKNQNKPIIVEPGTEINEFKGYSNKDNSIVELRKESVLKICRIYRISPHMLQLLDNATYSNITQQSIDFYKQTLMPHIQRQEWSIKHQLIPFPDKKSRYVKLNSTSVLRGSDAERASYYDTLIKNGTYSINEVRSLEDLPKISHPNADYHFIQLSTAPIENYEFKKEEKE